MCSAEQNWRKVRDVLPSQGIPPGWPEQSNREDEEGSNLNPLKGGEPK